MICVSSVCTSKFHIFFSRSPREWGHLINVSVLRCLSKFCASLCFCYQPPPLSPALNTLRTNEKPFRQCLLFFAIFLFFGQQPWMTVPSRGPYSENESKGYKNIKKSSKGYCPISHLSLTVLWATWATGVKEISTLIGDCKKWWVSFRILMKKVGIIKKKIFAVFWCFESQIYYARAVSQSFTFCRGRKENPESKALISASVFYRPSQQPKCVLLLVMQKGEFKSGITTKQMRLLLTMWVF